MVIISVVALNMGWALTGLAQSRTDPTAVTEQKALAAAELVVGPGIEPGRPYLVVIQPPTFMDEQRESGALRQLNVKVGVGV